MSKIENIEKTFNEIACALASNEKICRLLYIDKPDALTTNQFTQPSIEFLFENKYVNTCPQRQSGIQDLGRNSLLILRISSVNFEKDSTGVHVYADCSIITNYTVSMLDNNKDRALVLAGLIEDELSKHKFSSAIKVNVDRIESVVYSEYEFGYGVSFEFQDQVIKKKVEI